MMTWQQFSDYAHTKYKIASTLNEGNTLKLVFDIKKGRSQLVFCSRTGNDAAGEWVEIWSPVGDMNSKQTRRALAMVQGNIIGGLVGGEDEMVILKHAMPLATFNASDFEWAIGAIVQSADEIEEEVLGIDTM